MILTEQQQDAMAELINIAFSRTAASLSDLTGQRVLLDAPQVELRPLAELGSRLVPEVRGGDVATVHQPFAGPVNGDAFLLLNRSDAVILTNLLTDTRSDATRLDTSAREVLTEVGNILLNACLGVFGNLLQMHITFAVPRLHLQALHALIDSVVVARDELRYALLIYTSFRLRESAVSGYLVIVLGVASLDALIQALETLG
jgi:chemotaxis protein CheC